MVQRPTRSTPGRTLDPYTTLFRSEELMGKERSVFLVCEMEEKLTEFIYSRVVKMDVGKLVVEKLIVALKDGGLSNVFGPMSFLVSGSLIDSLGEKLEPIISQMILAEAEEMIRTMIEKESLSLQQTALGEFVTKAEPHKDVIKRTIISSYKKFVTDSLSSILTKLDIAHMIEERILEFDALTLEKMILTLMRKELRTIVWLGALLGGIMGCIMSFI